MKKTKTFMLSLMMMLSTAAVVQGKVVKSVKYSIGDGGSFIEFLNKKFGSSMYAIDSIVVSSSGQLPSDWAEALCACCEKGRLTGINLSGCEYLKEIPAGAFMSRIVNQAPTRAEAETDEAYLTKLQYITLPSCLEKIGESAFCLTDLRRIEIPYWVSEVGNDAFAGCVNLIDVVLCGNRVCDDAMAEFSGLPAGAVLHVAPGQGVNYRGKAAWAAFGEVREDDTAFRALELTLDGSMSLAEMLGDDNMRVDSLKIRGLICDEDYETLRDNSWTGRLYSIDISDYDVEASHGITLFSSRLNTLVLPRVLPELSTAFLMSSYVRHLVLPESYEKICAQAFYEFDGITPDSVFVVPEGCKRINYRAFVYSDDIKTLMLPSTLDVLEPEALAFNWARDWDDRPIDIYVNRMFPPTTVAENDGEYRAYLEGAGPFGCSNSRYMDENRCLTRSWRLFVPVGAKKNYENAEHWNHFFTIVETPLLTGVSDGIDAVTSDRVEASVSDGVYSLDGRLVTTSANSPSVSRGLYIVKEKGLTRKVVIGK